MVVFHKNPVRSFNGVNFYTVEGTSVSLFLSVEMERGYAYGREVTTGSTPPNKVLQRTTAPSRKSKVSGTTRRR